METIVLSAEYSVIEPLGLYYLATVAKQEGWKPEIVLTKAPDYKEFYDEIERVKPSLIGFTLYTGNHTIIANHLKKIKNQYNLKVIVGGPHSTYFPKDCLEFADFVVVGDGFNSFRRILKGEASAGIVFSKKREKFPFADREDFYNKDQSFRDNVIKNIVASTGCPYNCTYCYNSNNIDNVKGLNDNQLKEIKEVLYPAKRFFPFSQRPVDDVVNEIKYIKEIAPKTKFIFFEDDVFGSSIDWLKTFVDKYQRLVPFHINMRFEIINASSLKGIEKLNLLKEAGCTGFSIGIESGDPVVRREILNRNINGFTIFNTMIYLRKMGFKVRTYQMIGLPYGVTSQRTRMHLNADLQTLEFVVYLKQNTGLPTIAWASTLAPYPGTKIADYCSENGFYRGNFKDLVGSETYRVRSVLNFLKKWKGNNSSYDWMDLEDQEEYKNKLNLLMNYFSIFALINDGHELAREFLEQKDRSPERFIEYTKDLISGINYNEIIESFLRQEDRSPANFSKIFRNYIYDNILFK